jgi:hypothetical protein
MNTDKRIVNNLSEFAYGSSIHDFNDSIHHVLTHGVILKKDMDQPYVLGVLLFMDFWNIGVLVDDAKQIMHHLVHSSNPSNVIQFLFLSQENLSPGIFIRKSMSIILNALIDLRINHIINDYEARIRQNKNVSDSKQKIENFTKIHETINDYFSTRDAYPIEIWNHLLKLEPEKDVDSNKTIIFDLFKEIKPLKK